MQTTTKATTRNLNDLSSKYHPIFHPLKNFNRVQSQVFDDVIKTKKHIVVSAPTGSGKTAIFELAIVEILMSFHHSELQNVKIVYVAPTKALCNEMYQNWLVKFQPFDLKTVLVTGDSDPTEMATLDDLLSYQIVVTTPEKWDSMTRKWKNHHEIAAAVRLVLIDEVHLVDDTYRGPTLEAIVSRMKTFPNPQQIRFVAVSAVLPNIEDIGKWLSAGQLEDAAKAFQFDESNRPVQLRRHILGFTSMGNSFQFANTLTYQLTNIVRKVLLEAPNNEQILIFCQSRSDVDSSLARLRIDHKLQISKIHQSRLEEVSKRVKDADLRSCILLGFGYHHASLWSEDRDIIENAYRAGLIRILLSTSTLAMGVNLPAHTVIIKSTETFMKGACRDIPDTMILQMMGRAGRLQYNSSGCVYIMTKQERVRHYEQLTADTAHIDSHLHKKLAEFLNAEIILNTITNDQSLAQWFRTTYLYTRICRSKNSDQADDHLKDLCLKEINLLHNAELAEVTADGQFGSLPFGAVMAKHFLSFPTMYAFREFRGNESMVEIIDKMVNCNEFAEFYLRRNEKNALNAINTGYGFPHPIPGKIQTNQHKVLVLLQAFMNRVSIDSSSLLFDAEKMAKIAYRMTCGLIEYLRTEQFSSNCFNGILSATILAKSLRTRSWNENNIYKALNIAEVDANKLIRSGIETIENLLETHPREIEELLNKVIPFGDELINAAAKKFPCYHVNVEVKAGPTAVVHVTQTNIRYEYQPISNGGLILLVGDSSNNLLLYEDIDLHIAEMGFYEITLSCASSANTGFVHLFHHNLIGADKTVQFKTMIPEKRAFNLQYMSTGGEGSSKLAQPKPKRSKNRVVKSVADSTDQRNLFQYFKKVALPWHPPAANVDLKSPAARVSNPNSEAIPKPTPVSPDLFSTQGSIRLRNPPVNLYNYDYAAQFSLSNTPLIWQRTQGIRQERAGEVVGSTQNGLLAKRSPFLSVTPIQTKLNEQRLARNDASGFVQAKNIFKKDIVEHPEFDDDFDQVFDELLQDELNRWHASHPAANDIFGLNRVQPRIKSNESSRFISKILNLNIEKESVEAPIQHDFDLDNISGDIELKDKKEPEITNEDFFSISECDEPSEEIHRNYLPMMINVVPTLPLDVPTNSTKTKNFSSKNKTAKADEAARKPSIAFDLFSSSSDKSVEASTSAMIWPDFSKKIKPNAGNSVVKKPNFEPKIDLQRNVHQERKETGKQKPNESLAKKKNATFSMRCAKGAEQRGSTTNSRVATETHRSSVEPGNSISLDSLRTMSFCSDRATIGSPVPNRTLSKDHSHAQQQKDESSVNFLQRDFMAPDSPPPQAKRQKFTIEDLLKSSNNKNNGEAHNQKAGLVPLAETKRFCNQPGGRLQVGKTSLKNAFARVQIPIATPECEANDVSKRCYERHSTDENYTREQYNLDSFRYIVHKQIPAWQSHNNDKFIRDN